MQRNRNVYDVDENQLTVKCTTRVERVLISIRCQKDMDRIKELVTFSSRYSDNQYYTAGDNSHVNCKMMIEQP